MVAGLSLVMVGGDLLEVVSCEACLGRLLVHVRS